MAMAKGSTNDMIMLNEDARLATFKYWPYSATDGAACTAEKMAEAGFYCCGGQREPDLVRCYFCRKELDGWEPQDEPWPEHASHAKGNCAYINLDKRPAELTVEDVFGVLEPERARRILQKNHENWEKEFRARAGEMRKKIDALAPKCG